MGQIYSILVIIENVNVEGPIKVNRIVFNFPHIGGSQTEDVQANQTLLSEFFRSCQNFFKHIGIKDGEIHVTLRQTPFYDSWQIVELANKAGCTLKTKVPFVCVDFNSYSPQRTTPSVIRAQPPSTENAFTYVFQ